jgi:hypothetical protein
MQVGTKLLPWAAPEGRLVVLLLSTLLASGAVVPAAAVRLGVFADPQATSCSATIPTGPFTLYVLAVLDGPPDDGLVGAEFRIVGIPSGWFASFEHHVDATIRLGDARGDGCALAFTTCHRGSNRIVQIGTLSGYATTNAPGVLRIEPARLFRNTQPESCAVVTRCDESVECNPAAPAPGFSKVCVESSDFYFNGSPCTTDAPAPDAEAVTFRSPWPNPTRSTVQLDFGLAHGGMTVAEVFDVAGRLQRTLLQARLAAGNHNIVWDGRTASGLEAPSGIYFLRLRCADRTLKQRVTLLR